MIPVYISPELRIANDKYSFTLQKLRKRKRKGKQVNEWESFKWFTSLENAVNGCATHLLMISESSTLSEVLEEHKSIHNKLCQALTHKYEISSEQCEALHD